MAKDSWIPGAGELHRLGCFPPKLVISYWPFYHTGWHQLCKLTLPVRSVACMLQVAATGSEACTAPSVLRAVPSGNMSSMQVPLYVHFCHVNNPTFWYSVQMSYNLYLYDTVNTQTRRACTSQGKPRTFHSIFKYMHRHLKGSFKWFGLSGTHKKNLLELEWPRDGIAQLYFSELH